jgi:hypothetical protein
MQEKERAHLKFSDEAIQPLLFVGLQADSLLIKSWENTILWRFTFLTSLKSSKYLGTRWMGAIITEGRSAIPLQQQIIA